MTEKFIICGMGLFIYIAIISTFSALTV